MRRSLSHVLNLELSRGFGAWAIPWVEMAVSRAAFLQRLRKGVGFMVDRKVAVGAGLCTAGATTRCRRLCATF
jgi:hypothetical protein